MIIKEQAADKIYNVAGSLFLENTPEIKAQIDNENQKTLQLIHAVSFYEILKDETDKKHIVFRETPLQKIKGLLAKNQGLVYGPPGIGKTTVLLELAKGFENVVYISIKGRTPLIVLSHLINKISQINSVNLIEPTDLIQGYGLLEASLKKSNQLFVVDDCESNPDLAKGLMTIQKFDSKFLFSSRDASLFIANNIDSYELDPFDRDEIIKFLRINNKNVSTLTLNRLISSSQGSPLYLFYYTQYSVSPLPKSLIAYQNQIWDQASTSQRELLTYISIPYRSLTIADLSLFLSKKSPLELLDEIESVSTLVKNREGFLEIFHPSFKEHLITLLKSKGILNIYQVRLGDFFLKKRRLIQATYLLIEPALPKVNKHLLTIFATVIDSGDLEFAKQILTTKFLSSKTYLEKGYIQYHLFNINKLLGNRTIATQTIDRALDFLRKSKSNDFYLSAMIFKAMDLLDNNQKDEAMKISDEVEMKLHTLPDLSRGQILVNLSKVYVDIYEFKKGAKVSKEAYDIFAKSDFYTGQAQSLTNMITCISQLPEYKDDIQTYGLKALEMIEKYDAGFLPKLVVYNTLSSSYREAKDFGLAKKYSMMAIELSQKSAMRDKAILNLVNYGNILRDEGDLNGAETVFQEALLEIKELKLKKELVRVHWILASLKKDQGLLDEALVYSSLSISHAENVDFDYGAANAWITHAEILVDLKRAYDAALAYKKSAFYYRRIKLYVQRADDSLSKAIHLLSELNNQEEVKAIFDELLAGKLSSIEDFTAIAHLNLEVSHDQTTRNFHLILDKYFSQEQSPNIIRLMLSFIEYCKSLPHSECQAEMMKVMSIIISKLGQTTYSFSILGIMLEQSGTSLNSDSVKGIASLLGKKLPLFNYRDLGEMSVLIASLNGQINLEIFFPSDELFMMKLAILIVMLIAERPIIIDDEILFSMQKLRINIDELTDNVVKLLAENGMDLEPAIPGLTASIHLESKGDETPEIIFILKEYENGANFFSNSEQKISLFFSVQTLCGIKGRFLKRDIRFNTVERTVVLNYIAELYDYKREYDDKKDFEVNITGLGELPSSA